MVDLSFFLHVGDSYLYLQVHLLDQVKRAANLRVYLSLVAELCSSNTPDAFGLVVKEERDSGSTWSLLRKQHTNHYESSRGCKLDLEPPVAEECP